MGSTGVWRMWESDYFRNRVWPEFKKLYPADARKVERLAASGGTATDVLTPRANFARGIFEEMKRHKIVSQPPPPPPPPPPPVKRYAPRTYNLASNNSDPRFCCKPEYGVVDKGSYYEDEMGCWYDKEHMFSIGGPGGYRDRGYMVQGLNEANNMNGKEPCDPYVSDSGLSVPPYPGDPIAQTGSYHR